MKKILIVLYLILFPFLLNSQEITIGVLDDIPPISYIEEENIIGIFPDLVKEVCRLNDYDIRWVEGSFSYLLEKIKNNEIDIIITIIKSPGREEFIYFNNIPIISSWSQIFTSKNHEIKGITDINNRSVGIMKSDQNGKNFIELANKFNIKYSLIKYSNYTNLKTAVLDNLVDVGIFFAHYGLTENQLKPTNIIFSPYNFHIGTNISNKKSIEFLEIFDTQLTEWKTDLDSYYYEVYENYFQIIKTPTVPSWIYFVTIGPIILALLLYTWSWILKRRLETQTLQLSDQEKKFRNLYENINQGVIYYSKDKKIIELNSTAEKLFNIDKKHFINKTFKDLIKELNIKIIHENGAIVNIEDTPLMKVIKKNKEITEIIGLNSKSFDGYKWVVENSAPEFDLMNSDIIRYYQTFNEITDLKLALDKIEEREKESKKIIENMSSGFAYHKMIFNKDGIPYDYEFIQTNNKFHELTGIPRNCIGKTLRQINENIAKETANWIQTYGEVAITQSPKKLEKYSDTLEKWFDITAYSPKEGYFVAILNDITDRKNNEQILKASEDALIENQKRLSITFESIGDGVIAVDTNLKVTMMNKVAKNILEWESGYFGIDLKQILKIENINIEGKSIREISQQVLKKKKTYYINQAELYIEHLDVTKIIEDSISPIYDGDNVYGLVIVFRDITEKVLSEEKTQELEQQLNQAQKMESIGQFSGGIAHNFNNIITAINGYVSLIEYDIESKGKDFEYLNEIREIKNAANKASTLTSQLLTVSKRQSTNPDILDVKKVMSDLVIMMKSIAGENIEIKTNFNSTRKIKVDQNQIEQIVLNFIANSRDALKDSRKKEKRITIETYDMHINEDQYVGVNEDEYVVIKFSDNGIGIPDHIKNKIFDPFFTTKEKGKGSGLGLSTVYGIVKQNNASIQVHSEINEGTTFEIFWPVTKETKISDTKKLYDSENIYGTENILFVEDEPSLQKLAKQYLTKLGYKIVIAVDGKDGWKQLNGNISDIDIVVTDIIMPKMSGIELYEKMKKINPNLKVLFTSGYTKDYEVNEKQIYENSKTDFISKPYSLLTLAQKIREILDN